MSHTVRRIVRSMNAREPHAGAGGLPVGQRGADGSMMRELNRFLVLNCVREQGPLARVSIAHRTGLSRTTVSSIIDALIKEGFVREGSLLDASPTGGRRAILVHFNADAGYILGVDAGRTHLTFIATNLAAEIVAHHSGPFDAARGPDVCLPELVCELRAFTQREGITWDHIIGVGLGIPGPMDARLRKLISPPRMPGWDGVDIRQILRRELNVPIYLDNDANMGALGESRFGAGRKVSELAYVKVGTGIGCGLVINGVVYRGSRGSAGELGHVTIDANGELCECGNRGCLETMAGAPAIARDAASGASLNRQRAEAGLPPVTLDRPVGDAAHIDAATVVRDALNGDPSSRAAIERAGELIGVALAGLINLFNPSLVLLDGGVARAGDLLIRPVVQAMKSRSLSAASAYTRVAEGALGDSAVAMGGVATVLDAAFGRPSLLGEESGESQPELPIVHPELPAVNVEDTRASAHLR